MSKESFIGGDYIETTGGSSKTFAKGTISLSGSQVINDGKSNGVLLGVNKKSPNLAGAVVTFAYIAKIVKDEYHQIKSASVGDTVYVVVRTTGLVERKVEVNLINSDGALSGKSYGVLDLLQDGKDVDGLLSSIVDKEGLAVYKVKLQPTTDSKGAELWSNKINRIKDKKANLCILVDAEKHNKDLKITYLGKNPTDQANNNSQKSEKPNYWQDGDGKWFEVKYCECSSYKIENDILNGSNVTQTKANSKVKGNNGIQSIIAIILHRTTGSSIAGAIAHSKGTHFYVEAARGIDGEIFQPIKLNQYSNHIMNQTARTAHMEIQTENSIGIEVIGMAYYKKGNDLYTVYDTKVNDPNSVKLSKAFKGQQKINGKWTDTDIYWDQLTAAQIKSVKCLVITLMKKYNLKKENIFTHEEIQSKTAGEGQVVKDAIFSLLNECI